mgnify:CR=1 FL=1
MKKSLYILFLICSLSGIYGQDHHPWCERPQNEFGKYISRTINKLEKSSFKKPQKVNIIVYGQSLSKQSWWLILKDSLEARYPSADLNMINRSIGGFSSQKLWKTTNFDILPSYPDLVIFHVFGSHVHYKKILKMIRSRTSAEMLVWNDPYTGENSWLDTMSYHLIPKFCKDYKLEFANIRTPWIKHLETKNLPPAALLKEDHSHLNPTGNELLSKMLLMFFNPVDYPDKDPYSLTDTLDLRFEEEVNRMDFTLEGNAVEIILRDSIPGKQKFRVLIDGLPPSEFQGGYYHTRPNKDTTKDWPWETGALYHLENHNELENEHWVLKLTSRDDSLDWFSYELHGSISGFDGAGTSRMPFISNSGKIVIQPEDWFLKKAWERTGIEIEPGYQVKWETYTQATDFITSDLRGEKIWLAQGLTNGRHLLQIVAFGDYPIPIKKIIIHKPYVKE